MEIKRTWQMPNSKTFQIKPTRFNTYHEAEHQLFAWEHEDKCNGEYTENFYEIVESEETK